MQSKSRCKQAPLLQTESKSSKEFSLCLPIGVRNGEQIIHNLLSIHAQMFNVR